MSREVEKKSQLETAKIKVGYQCSQSCVFCECDPKKHLAAPSTRSLAEKIMLAGQMGVSEILFTGGEATERPDFHLLVALANRLKLRCGVVTHGGRLADKPFATRAVKAGLTRVRLSLHAGEPDRHDELTRTPGSFQLLMAALGNLKRLGANLEINTVLHSQNLEELPKIARILRPFAPILWRVRLIEIGSSATEERLGLIPDLTPAGEAVIRLMENIDNEPESPAPLRVEVSGFPLCSLGSYAQRNRNSFLAETAVVAETYDRAFRQSQASERIKPPPCAACRLKEGCPGVDPAYLERHGTDALAPMEMARSNSFVFEPQTRVHDFNLARCPILHGTWSPEDPGRSIIVKTSDTHLLTRTDSADFTPDQILDVKHRTGQIYTDLSGKLFHDDFAKDLRKLAPHPVCRACPRFLSCPNVWIPESEDLFEAAEETVRGMIRDLRGKVLDIGGGPVRYGAEFSEKLEEGEMDYTVIEPSPPRLLTDLVARFHPRSRLIRGFAEHVEMPDEGFDILLVLRSHNHLRDLPRAYRRFYRWIRPGGEMIVVDNTAYGVVRTEEVMEVIRKQGGMSHFEHFNNHDSRSAVEIATKAGFIPLEESPVRFETANQWWARFRKARSPA